MRLTLTLFLLMPALAHADFQARLLASEDGVPITAVETTLAAEALAAPAEAREPASVEAEAHPQDDVFRRPGPRIPASLDPRAENTTPAPEAVAETQPSQTTGAQTAEEPPTRTAEAKPADPTTDAPELTESERFRQVYREIEQSFRARGASPQLLKSLMNALKQPIRDATRGPASEANVVDVRRIDDIMRRYIEAQDEDPVED